MKTSKVYLVSGGKASGKTKSIKKIIYLLRQRGLNPGGIYSEGFWENGERSHYEVVGVAREERALLCSSRVKPSWFGAGKYFFNPEGVRLGSEILMKNCGEHDLLLIDEVGRLETKKMLWYDAIQKLLANNQAMIWAVRDEFTGLVTRFFGLDDAVNFSIKKYTPEAICDFVVDDIQKNL
ncbi:MAG: nucleoside-triphosphatase [Bacteroidota bacterium]|nr:nucleoside-triphosphatase [Bacteroidota bacterium]